MKEADIRSYAELMKELGLTGLEITDDQNKVRLERCLSASVQESTAVTPQAMDSSVQNSEPTDYISVKSPVVGVFYAAPAENAQPFVSLGDHVSKGQTLCIVEAMKLMNEIPSEVEGEITEVCVTNGQIVEYGTELFHIKR